MTLEWYQSYFKVDSDIVSAMKKLYHREIELEHRRSSHSPCNSRLLELRIKLPTTKPRDLWMLYSLLPKGILGVSLSLVIQSFQEKYPKLSIEEKWSISKMKDRFLLKDDWNYLDGRVQPRLLWLLRNIRIDLVEPRKPKRTQRVRGYRDHGRLAKFDAKFQREANSFTDPMKEFNREVAERSIQRYNVATEILSMEREGRTYQDIVEFAEGSLSNASQRATTDFSELSSEAFQKLESTVYEEKVKLDEEGKLSKPSINCSSAYADND